MASERRDGRSNRNPDPREQSTHESPAPPAPGASGLPGGVDPAAPTVLDDPDAEPSGPLRRAVEIAPGTVLFGEYEIEGLLGSGGMGAVYRARHRRLGEPRAIKVLQTDFGASQEAASKLFDREAKALLKLRDPAVVRCHDLLSDDEGRVFLVMELVEGTPLSLLLERGPLSDEQVLALGRRLASGLSAAHRQGIVHRDLAPDNVVLPEGRPEAAKLIDFGIAKEFESAHTTVLDGFKGKLRFASPEQMGFFDGKIDGRSDYYSLGLTLYAAATGEPLEMGRTFAQAVDARRAFKGLPRGIPAPLRDVIEPLLAFDPDDRPRSLEEHFGLTDAAPREAKAEGSRRWIYALVVPVLAAGGAAAWLARGPAPPTPASEPAADAVAPSAPPAREVAAPDAPAPEQRTSAPARREPTAQEKAALIRRQLQIDSLLRAGAEAVRENRLTLPLGESALDKYRRVLELDGSNREARRGLDTVSDRLLDMALAALERGDIDQAQDLYEKAEATTPKHPRLAPTRSAIASARDGR